MEVRMSLADAASLTGVATNTIRSRFKAGKIRGERDNAGKIWVWIDPDLKGSKSKSSKPSIEGSNDASIEVLREQLERSQKELLALREKAARVDILDAEKALLVSQIEDLKSDRDAWRRLSERRGFWSLFTRAK